MGRRSALIIIGVLVLANILLLWQNQELKSSRSSLVEPDSISYLYAMDTVDTDIRGIYTYPGLGVMLMPHDEAGNPIVKPLTLAICFSAKMSCRISEVQIYKRLVPVFESRGQSIIAVAYRADSTIVADSLASWELDVPLIIREGHPIASDFTYEQMGISFLNMPFKILYDSTMTAIYIRGANNTPESQHDFEQAMLRLSEFVANGVI